MKERIKILRFLPLSLIILMHPHPGNCQGADFDSLRYEIERFNINEQVNKLKEAALQYRFISLEQARYFADKRQELVTKLNNDSLLADNLNLFGNIYLSSELYSQAEDYYSQALSKFIEIDNLDGKATVTHNLGILYFRNNDTLRTIDYFRRSLDARMETGNDRRIGDGLTTIGEIYRDYGYYKKSIENLLSAVDYYSNYGSYPRKYDCFAFLFDSFMMVDSKKAQKWIKEMEKLYLLDTTNQSINPERYLIRQSQYNLYTGNIQAAIDVFNRIDFRELNFINDFRYIESIKYLSEVLMDRGQYNDALRFSEIARKLNNEKYYSDVRNTIGSFKIRLNILSTEEETARAEELNQISLMRIKTEKAINTSLLVILLLMVAIMLTLLYSYFKLKRYQNTVDIKSQELKIAYARSIEYKNTILQLKAEKNKFFNVISNKLAEPFSVLDKKINSLSSATRSPEEEYLRTELKETLYLASSLEKSLKRILLWSKLQRKRYQVEKVYIKPEYFFNDMLPELIKIGLDKKIKIRYDIDPQLLINYDKNSLSSIIRVFVENGVDNTDFESDIILRAYSTSKGAIISVSDNGKGMSKELQENIFNLEEFSHGVSKSHEKLGLGLLLAKGIAELNNSKISFESEPGKGTTFSLHIK